MPRKQKDVLIVTLWNRRTLRKINAQTVSTALSDTDGERNSWLYCEYLGIVLMRLDKEYTVYTLSGKSKLFVGPSARQDAIDKFLRLIRKRVIFYASEDLIPNGHNDEECALLLARLKREGQLPEVARQPGTKGR